MTIKKLIEELQKLDPNLRVFTTGYEGGFHDASIRVPPMDFKLNHYEEWWYGPHEIAKKAGEAIGHVKGIVIGDLNNYEEQFSSKP